MPLQGCVYLCCPGSRANSGICMLAGKRRKAKGAAGGGDGNLSDWGQGAAAAAAGGPAAAAERREEARLLREGLKLMAAEVAFRWVGCSGSVSGQMTTPL